MKSSFTKNSHQDSFPFFYLVQKECKQTKSKVLAKASKIHDMKTEANIDLIMDDDWDKKPNVTQMLPRASLEENRCNLCDYVSQKKSRVKKHKLLLHSKPSIILRIPLKSLKMKIKEKRSIPVEVKRPMADMKLMIPNNICNKSEPKTIENFVCKFCNYSSYKNENLIVHMNKFHKGDICIVQRPKKTTNFVCDLCDYSTDQNGHLKRHTLSKHTAYSVKCNQCDVSLKPNNLTRHMKEVHREAKELSCKDCNFTTLRLQHLKEHIDCKHGLVKLVCGLEATGAFCKYSTAFVKKLEEHKLRKHLGVPRLCGKCSFEASSRDILYHHINREHKNMQHQCILCDKTFTKNASLKNHIKSLHVKETEKCNLCDKVYTGRSGLKLHMQSKHLNVTFSCKHCLKGFHSRGSRQVHIKSIHLSEKSECSECGKTFNSDSAVRKHKTKAHKLVKKEGLHC